MTKSGWVYILTNKRNGTLYIGVTSELPQRIWQHREGLIEGFSKKYGLKTLVSFQHFDNLHDARRREVQMKGWKRAWKIELIEEANPEGATSILTFCASGLDPGFRRGSQNDNPLMFPGESRGP